MLFFCFNHPSTTEIYTLSLHDALPIWGIGCDDYFFGDFANLQANVDVHAAADVDDHTLLQELLESRSEEHTSELQSRLHLVCRLLLEKKKKIISRHE